MEFEKLDIKCNNFLDVKATIERTEIKIRDAQNPREKQYCTQDILLEAKALMSCSNYDDKNQDCLNCHFVSLRYIQEYKHLPKMR